jgi:hypothetical protein
MPVTPLTSPAAIKISSKKDVEIEHHGSLFRVERDIETAGR